MSVLLWIADMFLHLDRYLGDVVMRFGAWAYILLFLVIFLETGLVVTPFLPGDSLLFAAGTFAALGSLNVFWVFVLMAIAAILGDSMNYWIGHRFGVSFFETGRASFLHIHPEHIEKTRRFYERHGGKTVILARFIPIIRTFAPFIAGIGAMRYQRFLAYNIVGGVLWVGLFTVGGFLFGNLPGVREHFSLVILGIILASILPAVVTALREHRSSTSSS